ncbi:hypothetical protein P20480_2421 [Pseudoalteromonas sp. BSi20480]|nr:hypothetical protein P20480_2421 [Pseudoalteromonas sp. BSi20480]
MIIISFSLNIECPFNTLTPVITKLSHFVTFPFILLAKTDYK